MVFRWCVHQLVSLTLVFLFLQLQIVLLGIFLAVAHFAFLQDYFGSLGLFSLSFSFTDDVLIGRQVLSAQINMEKQKFQ